jgi:hypothetical protein
VLLEHGASLNARRSEQEHATDVAVLQGHTAAVQSLLELEITAILLLSSLRAMGAFLLLYGHLSPRRT